MIALGRALAARGHEVTLQTWTRWRADVRAQGMTFAPAPEYQPFPTDARPLSPYQAVLRATREPVTMFAQVEFDVTQGPKGLQAANVVVR